MTINELRAGGREGKTATGPAPRKKRRPRAIGTDAERAVVRYLQATGWPAAERRALRGRQDAGDITGTPGICWEVKGGDQARRASDRDVAQWLAEAERERQAADADVAVLVLQRAGVGAPRAGRWWAIVPLWAATYLQAMTDRADGAPAYTGGADLYAIGASDPRTPWMRAPARLLLADAVALLRAAGYGTPPEVTP